MTAIESLVLTSGGNQVEEGCFVFQPLEEIWIAPSRCSPYLDATLADLGLRLDATAGVAPAPAQLPARVGRTVRRRRRRRRLATLVGEHRRDRVSRVSLDEEPVQGGGRSLRDGGGLMRRIGLVRVAAVDHAALRDVDAGGAAHPSAALPPRRPRPDRTSRRDHTKPPAQLSSSAERRA